MDGEQRDNVAPPSYDAPRPEGEVDVEWELSKENVLPLKRGRSTASIKRAFGESSAGAGTSVGDRLATLKSRHEKIITDYEGEDPLAPWLEYIKTVQDDFPSNQTDHFELLERCSRRFKDNACYKNDMRYLRVWMAYADNISNTADLFKFLYKKEIGGKLALFWVAWAWAAEIQGKYPLAETLLEKGVHRLAEPVGVLKKRHKEFMRRMRRLWINRQEEAGEDADAAAIAMADNDFRRKALETLEVAESEQNSQQMGQGRQRNRGG
ncbi:unnamed protein product, partial [Discosporangium mesarthrocarpum]